MCFAGKQFPGKRDKIRFANFTRYRGSREVHIDMFDDRIEITSPGGMFGEIGRASCRERVSSPV